MSDKKTDSKKKTDNKKTTDSKKTDSKSDEEMFYTARHLLEALQGLDESLLDHPLVLVHGKDLHKTHLIHGFVPSPLPVVKTEVEAKKPALLVLASLAKLKKEEQSTSSKTG